eukprot:6174908-Pleurochrysis_carterae.AAC.1
MNLLESQTGGNAKKYTRRCEEHGTAAAQQNFAQALSAFEVALATHAANLLSVEREHVWYGMVLTPLSRM